MDMHGLSEKLLIIAVITLFFTLFFTTGAFQWVTGRVSGTCDITCVDTDKGDEFVIGTISGNDDYCNKFKKTDYCSSSNSNQLKEYRCDEQRKMNWYSEIVTCEKGCLNGACIQ
ncbi:MAG: hypothetical protein KJ623_01340 [Nanoarchaeota archaeon]|nr:hypothetical protein [Nanoarchaeota archaeon]MBU0963083.1 hypothetical protein [Nanoarchaeota archaeon]